MAEKNDILNKLYNVIKSNLDFDGDSFFFNQAHILESKLEPLYKSLGIEEKISFQEFQEEIQNIGRELGENCKDSAEGQDMIKEARSALEFFNELSQKVASLNKKHFYVGGEFERGATTNLKVNPGAYEVVRPLTEKIQELCEKYRGALQGEEITKSDIEKDIRLLQEKYEEFKKVAATKEIQRSGALSKYEKICNELTNKMNSVMEISDKSQNFTDHKDKFLENAYSSKRSVGDIIMSKIKDFLEALGFKQDRSSMHKTEKFAGRILNERQVQGNHNKCSR